MNFPFYIGEIGENDIFEVVISRDVEYGDWQPFCYANVNEFEVYFTSKPAAVNNSLNRRDVNMVKCKFDVSVKISYAQTSTNKKQPVGCVIV